MIGASDYAHWPDLPGVRHDVERVRALLEGQGFRVSVVPNPDHAALRQAFERFINTHGLAEEDRLLFYFAGHGQTLPQAYGEADMGYIVPVDAPPRGPRRGSSRDHQALAEVTRAIQDVGRWWP